MDFELKILTQNRENVSTLLSHFTDEQLTKIPAGFRNNLLWNAGHIVVTQQMLSYGLCKIKPSIAPNMIEMFRKGTEARIYTAAEIYEVKSLLKSVLDSFKSDYEAGAITGFSPFYLSTFGIQLDTLEEAVKFNNFHEGLHYGYMLALKNAL